MKKKIFQQVLLIIGALFFLTFFTDHSVLASSSVVVNKTTTPDPTGDGRLFDVQYTIEVSSNKVEPTDVTIVLDRSNSMLNKARYTNNYIVNETLAATEAFIRQIMAVPGNRIAIVSYGTTAISSNSGNYYTSVNQAITEARRIYATRPVDSRSLSDIDFYRDGYKIRWSNYSYLQGATNIQDALLKAQTIATNKSTTDKDKAVVLFTDGEATEGLYVKDTKTLVGWSYEFINYLNPLDYYIRYKGNYGYEYKAYYKSFSPFDPGFNSHIPIYTYEAYNSEAAILQARDLKKVPNTEVYTIGYFGAFSNPSSQINTLEKISTSGDCYTIESLDQIAEMFKDINSKINNIGTSAVVTDQLNEGFEILEDSITAPVGTKVSISSDNSSLTWDIGSLGIGTHTFSMKVKVKDGAYIAGIENVLLSTSSKLSYTDLEGSLVELPFPDNFINVEGLSKITNLKVTSLEGASVYYVENKEEKVKAKVYFTTLKDLNFISLQLSEDYPDSEMTYELLKVTDINGNVKTGFYKNENNLEYSASSSLPAASYIAEIEVTSPSNFLNAVNSSGDKILKYQIGIDAVTTKDNIQTTPVTVATISQELLVQYNGGPVITITPSTKKFTSQVNANVLIKGYAPIVEYKCLKGEKQVSDFATIANGYGLNELNVSNNLEISGSFNVSIEGTENPVTGYFIGNGYYTLYAKDSSGKETIEIIKINNLLDESPDLL